MAKSEPQNHHTLSPANSTENYSLAWATQYLIQEFGLNNNRAIPGSMLSLHVNRVVGVVAFSPSGCSFKVMLYVYTHIYIYTYTECLHRKSLLQVSEVMWIYWKYVKYLLEHLQGTLRQNSKREGHMHIHLPSWIINTSPAIAGKLHSLAGPWSSQSVNQSPVRHAPNALGATAAPNGSDAAANCSPERRSPYLLTTWPRHFWWRVSPTVQNECDLLTCYAKIAKICLQLP